MTFGSQWEAIGALGQKEADALVDRSIDDGINFFDTADMYSSGESEEILGRSLKGKRQDVVIATKVRGRMGPATYQVGLSRMHIIEAAEASLKRLGTDYMDLYQIPRSDPETDIEETLIALTDLVRSGKVRYIGCSNTLPGLARYMTLSCTSGVGWLVPSAIAQTHASLKSSTLLRSIWSSGL
jgi:aryl-alcohol dehydrogenase-like predicted oxidoreductase